jgi:hypothetical protein
VLQNLKLTHFDAAPALTMKMMRLFEASAPHYQLEYRVVSGRPKDYIKQIMFHRTIDILKLPLYAGGLGNLFNFVAGV